MRLALASLLLLTTGCSWFSTRDEDFIIPSPPPRPSSPTSARPAPSSPGRLDPTPAEPAPPSRTSTRAYAEVRAGDSYTCARTEQDAIDCWGKTPNDPQHLGAEVAVRGDTVCVLDGAGKVTCWGDTAGYVVPDAGPLHSLGLGYRFACALDATNHPQCWGPAALAAPDDVELKTLSVGWGHACGLRTSDSTIVCWGNFATAATLPPTGSYVSIAAGGLMTCVLDAGDHLSCWGDYKGGVPAERFKQVSVGNGVACGVLAEGGTLTCFGNDLVGIKQVPPRRFSQVSIGTDHACAISTVDDTIECWGNNTYGQASPP